MFCKMCGKETNSGSDVCASCAEKSQMNNQKQGAEPANRYKTPSSNPYIQINTDEIKKGVASAAGKASDTAKKAAEAAKEALNGPKKDQYMLIGAAAVGVIFIVILLSIIGVFKPAYEKPIDNFVKSISKNEYDYLKKAFPKYRLKGNKDSFKDTIDEINEELEDEYGKRFKLKYKITDKDKLDEDDLEDYEDDIKDYYDKKVKVTNGYELEVEFKASGDGEKDDKDGDFIVLKIDGKWYITSADWSAIYDLY